MPGLRAQSGRQAAHPATDEAKVLEAMHLPIFMTDMVMIVGLLPMALITTTGSEFHRPLAVVYIGGFFFAIFLRLSMVPVLYETFMVWGRGGGRTAGPDEPAV